MVTQLTKYCPLSSTWTCTNIGRISFSVRVKLTGLLSNSSEMVFLPIFVSFNRPLSYSERNTISVHFKSLRSLGRVNYRTQVDRWNDTALSLQVPINRIAKCCKNSLKQSVHVLVKLRLKFYVETVLSLCAPFPKE